MTVTWADIPPTTRKWWKESVVYQIYPRSFMDSDGDGVGDIRGVIARLDYLHHLGVDIVWLCPIYQSPNDDNGYDISDYRSILPQFGTMQDFEDLLAGLHERGMRLIMDLVVNHTSDEHAWFSASKSSLDSPYRDYYIWRPGRGGQEVPEPNNWGSFFGGSVWDYDANTDAWYLHLFSRKQPDLNWENAVVRREIFDLMRWWLDKGVDGFRMDVINAISKTPGLPDAPVHGSGRYHWGGQYFLNGPQVHEWLRDMNEQVLSHYDIVTVGETPVVTPEDALLYAGETSGELNMVFQFDHMDIDSGPGGKWDVQPWKLTELKRILSTWQIALHGRAWNSLYLNNHDQPRLVSRFGHDGVWRVASAKLLATLLHTLQGTPYIYQGEEIGMTNVQFTSIDECRDIETLNMYRERVVEAGEAEERVLAAIRKKGRDNARTPMQWDGSPHAGFTQGEPWIAVNPNHRDINVQHALADPDSVLEYYRRLIALRRQHPVIVYGDYQLLLPDDEQIYAYLRRLGPDTMLVVLNVSAESTEFLWPTSDIQPDATLLLSNYPVETPASQGVITLRPYEARVYRA